ncbi:hypothetical protein IJI31_02950 [bacterium]|nr:hypothetical protein [bacterium]
MKITPIQFNFVQNKPQNTVSNPLRMNNGLQADTVSFSSSCRKEKTENPQKTLKDCVPKHKGIIYRKVYDKRGKIIKKEPVEVDIVKDGPDIFTFQVDEESLGYVDLSYLTADECKKIKLNIYKNYKDEGIEGDRIRVDFVENQEPDEYGGMGHLADLLEVAACKELGIEPNIVSHSKKEAAPLHYLRGKRFIPYEKYCSRSDIRRLDLKGKNPNDTIKEIIKRTPKGEKFNTDELPFAPLMYMPKSMAKELEEELKEHPIF